MGKYKFCRLPKIFLSKLLTINTCHQKIAETVDTSLLIKTFQKLSQKERMAVLALCRCDWFNRPARSRAALCPFGHQSGKAVRWAFLAENLFAAAFPGQPFENRPLRHVMSYLLDIVRRFVAIAKLETEAEQHKFFMVRGLD